MSWPKNREVRIAAKYGIVVVDELRAVPSTGPAILTQPILGRTERGVRFVIYRDGEYRGYDRAIRGRNRLMTWRNRRVSFKNAIRYLRFFV